MENPTCEAVAISLEIAKFDGYYNDACSASHLKEAEFKKHKLQDCDASQMNRVAQHCDDRAAALRGMLSFARCSSLEGAITLMAACRWSEDLARDMRADADGDGHTLFEAADLERKADRMWNEAIRFIAQTEGLIDKSVLYEMTGLTIRPDTIFDHEEVICERVSKAMKHREKEAESRGTSPLQAAE
ncbi:MAG: hypothetical protein AAFP81_19920 [Pseudomonadota bacterium]